MKGIKTLHIPIYRSDSKRNTYQALKATAKLVHTATIRSDWDEAAFTGLRDMFPDGYMISKSVVMPIQYVGQKSNYTDFRGLAKFA